jgi:hypothetical protein
MLAPNSPQKRLVKVVSPLLHAGEYFQAAKIVANHFEQISQVEMPTATKPEADAVLTLLLQWLLNNNGLEEAAQLLWGPNMFDPRPESTQRVWKAFEENNFILLMGAGSMSKSYSMAVKLFLEWLRDPEHTTVKVLGPSEQHLEDNLFTHLVSLHRGSTIPLPGQVNQLFIGLDPRERKSSISGVVIPLGKKAAGRLQGVKRANRKVPHPVFGKTFRMFIFLDEIANIPPGIWRDIDNLITGSSGDGLKIIGAFNPTNQNDEVGARTEPPAGWSMFDPDVEFEWVSTRGWKVVRLDAARCENVLQRKLVFPGLQTYEGFQMVIRNSGGMDSPGYWSMCRGCFPPTGVPMSIIPSGLLADVKAEILWYDHPTPVGAVDLAFNGSDKAIFIKGSFGPASGIRLPPSLLHPEGRTIMFKNAAGNAVLRDIVLAETMLVMPKGDTVEQAAEVMRIARIYNIRPDCLCVDRTGHGQGTYDMLRHNFGEVIGVNYSESASESKVMQEDHDIAKELYVRIHSELWFATRKFIEFGYLKLALGFSTEELFPQLTGRRFRAMGKKSKVEEKDDYKSRANGKSPDEADTITLLVQVVRRAFSFIPGMVSENSRSGYDDDDLSDVRIDVTNRTDDLDVDIGP